MGQYNAKEGVLLCLSDPMQSASELKRNVKVRPATREDGAFLAWVLLHAGRSQHPIGVFDRIVNGTQEETLSVLTDVITDESEIGKNCPMHWEGWFVAYDDGQEDKKPVAGLAGFPNKDRRMVYFHQLIKAILTKRGWKEEDFVAAGLRMKEIRSCSVTMSDSDEQWFVEYVATKPEYRRLGINNMLMEVVLAKGRKLGFKTAHITVLTDNTPAIKAYEKVGFREYNSVTSPDFLRVVGSPGIMNMRALLQ